MNPNKKYRVSFAPTYTPQPSPPSSSLKRISPWKKIKKAYYNVNRTLDKWGYFLFCI